MNRRQELKQLVKNVTPDTFEDVALAVFRWQAVSNFIYREYLSHLRCNPDKVQSLTQIPFMPIGFFKKHTVLTESPVVQTTFESSGTTGAQTSRHHVADLDWYTDISIRIFEQTYGLLSNCHLLALLPSYLERNNSSLVYMVQQFIVQTHSSVSGFFLHNVDELLITLKKLAQNSDGRTVILWGVTFALLDLAESEMSQDLKCLQDIPSLMVMETGGMKGRRREMLREEVHEVLTKAFGVKVIHSEYGMTELLSQSYSKGEGIFDASATMRILLRDINDPRAVYDTPQSGLRYGGINVVDLANLDSCAFIETQDLGRFVGENATRFEVIGRFDNSDVRGCNLLI
ncbi:acyl transferase [Runella sp. CRIBMP]|uniref:LuxE/PaaK family acyltransferase n=1 Tax=Runella sp. CRIBMP TaxID=2683261 RepID=UPI0014130288|nr:acyl transferase [Runella sp. CRIBMP]NBB22503.1 acyl transferase [Runella sp. CRIBMP]